MKVNRKLAPWIAVLLATLFGASTVKACGCVSLMQPDEEVRKYYQQTFNGAVFTGKIRTISKPRTFQVDGIASSLRELVIDVDLYWLGVKDPVFTAYTMGENSSCTMHLETDRSYFFIASRQDNRLHIGMCDLSSWRGRYPDKEWAEYTERILGPSKSFTKIQK